MCRTNLNSVKYAELCRKHWMLDQTSDTVFLIVRSEESQFYSDVGFVWLDMFIKFNERRDEFIESPRASHSAG